MKICSLYTCRPDFYSRPTHLYVRLRGIGIEYARAGGSSREGNCDRRYLSGMMGLVGILRFFLHNCIVLR